MTLPAWLRAWQFIICHTHMHRLQVCVVTRPGGAPGADAGRGAAGALLGGSAGRGGRPPRGGGQRPGGPQSVPSNTQYSNVIRSHNTHGVEFRGSPGSNSIWCTIDVLRKRSDPLFQAEMSLFASSPVRRRCSTWRRRGRASPPWSASTMSGAAVSINLCLA